MWKDRMVRLPAITSGVEESLVVEMMRISVEHLRAITDREREVLEQMVQRVLQSEKDVEVLEDHLRGFEVLRDRAKRDMHTLRELIWRAAG